MRIPKEIKYAGHTYKVRQPTIISPKEAKKKRVSYFGQVNFQKQVIKLRSSEPQTQKEQSLMHELIHIVDHHNKGGLKEEQVEYLAKDLYAILKSNKVIE